MKDNRRDFIKKGTSLAAALSLGAVGASASPLVSDNTVAVPAAHKVAWPVIEGPDTPKMTMNVGLNDPMSKVKAIKQFGADYVHMAGPRLPWTKEGIQTIVDKYKAEGLTVINMMVNFSGDIIHAGSGRDEEIKRVQDAIVAAGAAGIPVVEYNFYAHRLGEGYYNVEGRGGSGYLGYDYNRVNPKTGIAPKDLPPTEREPAMKKEELWANIAYFLKAVIPVAEKANVRLALHPNDPPAPISRGSEQIMKSFADWKHLFDLVDSPANGMTFDCGVSTEIGEDAVEVAKYMLSRNRINHVHFRNVIVEAPSTKYVETFPDNGQVNMFAVMQTLVRGKYKFGIFAEHPRANEIDKERGGDFISYIYNQAYARGVFQSVLTLEKGYKA
ncbi:MAG TPA: mannonate dehydratase [Mucilaginibacter sp.]|jgi:mannonate dehydratase|nr:mannonate dehydratase [Mucilaginibacter sp.]